MIYFFETTVMSWENFESQSLKLAEFAKTRLHNRIAYFANIFKDV